jgi:hypothetical protein
MPRVDVANEVVVDREELGVVRSALFVACTQRTDCKSDELCDLGVCISRAVKRGAGAPGDYCYRTEHCASRLCLCAGGLSSRAHFTLEEPRGACLPRSRGVACQAHGGLGRHCWIDENCQSDLRCRENACVPEDGTGQLSGYCHHANHCESRLCDCTGTGATISSGFCGSASLPQQGFCAARRGFGAPCGRDDNCPASTSRCVEGRCAPLDGTGDPTGPTAYCHHDNHCASSLCVCPGGKRNGFCGSSSRPETGSCWAPGTPIPFGGFCRADGDCRAGQCAEQRCAPRDGTGTRSQYCHHDNHCGRGLTCSCPFGKSWGFCADFEDGGNLGTCQPG